VVVRARVIRSMVWRLSADAVIYRAALVFENDVDTEVEGYGLPASSVTSEAGEGKRYPSERSGGAAAS
jgi:hypothetical protein